MALVNGSQILARSLRRLRVDTFFYIMGGPMMAAETASVEEGLRAIDVRHEQAAAMMAHAYGRVRNTLGVCMAASGPGATNLITGVANAWADCAPLLAIGGSAPLSQRGKGAFQEMDQVSAFKPITKWAEQVTDPRRVPEFVATAARHALGGRPGPVYLDMPGDVLYRQVEEDDVVYPDGSADSFRVRPRGDPALIDDACRLLAQAERPLILTGSGILWSGAEAELQQLVELAGIPFYTTPQGRGVVPDDHALSFLTARSTAFREADLLLLIGTRINYVIGHLSPPRFNAAARLVQVDIDPGEIGHNHPADVGIVGDARAVLKQLLEAFPSRADARRFSAWRQHLTEVEESKRADAEKAMSTDQRPIHPLRLCKEVRDFLDRDAILVVDGQEILNYGRQSIPTFVPRHRLNSGVFGTMGVGLPFGVGAKVAKPDSQVLVLHGDGSFGLNAMELDTCSRFNIPVVTVVSLNGGWTADPNREKTGRELGYTKFHKMAEALGCHGEYVEDPAAIRPALERAFKADAPALVNVLTDWRARATTAAFSQYST
ncbi:MAG: thiamine pyrophosphate-binding protein [Chloroflexi bacterium]|nr:thiamine pyrophosphate-binding protein [Chloroflexota bacterium]MBV9602250.1 thiamine pyrophosphate-binding protein [Chloroflexota bacterium]